MITVESGTDEDLTEALMGRALLDVFHDFNGLLAGLMGSLELTQLELGNTSSVAPYVDAALHAAHDINTLRSWLLSYVQGSDMPAHAVNINSLIANDLPTFVRLFSDRIDSHVKISTRLAPDLGYVLAQPTLLRRVLLNLMVNARDACGSRGHVRITTANGVRDGVPTVLLSVRDNGRGMSEETRARIFTPGGHTTKGKRGTGRGMLACQRTIAAYGGEMRVISAEAYGTIVAIALPRLDPSELAG